MAEPSSKILLIRALLERALAVADEAEAHYVAVHIAEAIDALPERAADAPPLRSTRAQ